MSGGLRGWSYSFDLHGVEVTVCNMEIAEMLRTVDKQTAEVVAALPDVMVDIPEILALLIDGMALYRVKVAELEDRLESEEAHWFTAVKGGSMRSVPSPNDTMTKSVVATVDGVRNLKKELTAARDTLDRIKDTHKLVMVLWEGARSLNANVRDGGM